MNNMDLSLKFDDTKLKIRVSALVKTKNGYLFERGDDGYIFTLGGKVKLSESSEEAVIRETMEEINFKVANLKLRALIENFYGSALEKVHEICFVYEVSDIYDGPVPNEFIEVPMLELSGYDIRPKQIIEILKNNNNEFTHYIVK